MSQIYALICSNLMTKLKAKVDFICASIVFFFFFSCDLEVVYKIFLVCFFSYKNKHFIII